MRKLLAIAALLGFTTFWACHLGPEDKSDNFDIAGDTAWTHCDTLEIILLDDSGMVLDTLFHDPLLSLSQLANLSADKYPGGTAKLSIKGYFKNGALCVEQTRTFEDGGSHVVVDTVKDPSASPTSITALPESLSLALGGPAVTVRGTVQPSYADQGLLWSMDSTGVASIDVAADSVAQVVKVKAENVGVGFLTLRSRKDGSRFAKVKVRVSAAAALSVTLDNDSLSLFVNGPGDSLAAVVTPFQADPRVSWSSAAPEIAKVDSAGRVTPGKAGRTFVTARAGNGKSDSALIIVVADVPKLTIHAKDGAPVNIPIIFSPVATQKVGHLVLYAWDLHGDGAWDDSLAGPWFGDSTNLPAVSGKYATEGTFKPSFRVRDSEGNTVIAEATVQIGNQAPEILAIRADTVISVKDSIAMTATVRDLDGKVAWLGWDYENDGQFDDTLVTADSVVEVVLGHRYHEAGNYLAILRAVDGNGKSRLDTAKIKVEFDEPVADAGNDTTVLVNGDIHLSIKGTDKYGPIVKREFRIDNGPFVSVSKLDTVFSAPAAPVTLTLVIRITDNDGLTDQDTMKVFVILSADADLANLAFSAGDLVPAFKPGTGSYAAQVGFADSLVRVTPSAKDSKAIITVNAKPISSGAASDPVKLQVGSNNNAFQILVTAPDGSQRNYALSVARNPNAEATLKSLTGTGFNLKPAFAANVLDYQDTVGYAVSSISLRPTVASIGATVAVNDSAIASGTPTGALPLQFGDNLFTVSVTAMDGNSKSAYKVRIVRLSKLYIYKRLGGAAAALADSAELPIDVPRAISSPGSVGFNFSRWTLLEGTATLADSTSNPTSLTMKSGLVKAQAQFDNQKYSITGSVVGCGDINPPGTVTLNHGESVNYTIIPKPNCRIVSVKIDGVEDSTAYDGSFTFGAVTGNRSIAAAFVRTYTLTGKAGNGGSITPTRIVVDSGSSQTFTIAPDNGKKILLKVDGVTVAPATTWTFDKVNADHLVEADFVAGYTLTAFVTAGSGSITPASVGVDSGGTATFIFKPSPSYSRIGLTDNGNPVKPTSGDTLYTLSGVKETHIIRVQFRRQYNISVSWTGPGEIVGAAGAVDSGASPTFNVNPLPGAVTSNMLVNGSQVAPPTASHTFPPIDGDRSIHAVFVRRFTVATTWGTDGSNGAGGSISPVNPAVDSGKSQLVSISPDIAGGYRLASLVIDDQVVAPTGTHTFDNVVDGKRHIQATFRKTYRVTGSAPGGTITPADTTVDNLGAVTFKFKPDLGSSFLSIMDNGKEVKPTGGDSLYALSEISSTHDIQVTFIKQYNVTVNFTGPGTVTGGPVGTVNSGSTSTFTITPNPGGLAFIGSMVANGSVIKPPTASHSFTGIDRNCTLSVVFVRRFQIPTTWGTSGNNHVGGSLSPENPAVDSSGNQMISIATYENYRLSVLNIDGLDASVTKTSHTFDPVNDQNHSMVATFIRTFPVTAVSAGGGSITPALATVDSMGSDTLDYKAFDGYHFDRLRCNNATQMVESGFRHILFNVAEAKACSVYFKREYTITGSVIGGIGGIISPSKEITVDSGTSPLVTMTPDPEVKGAGYRLWAAFDGGTVVPTEGSDIFGEQTYTIPTISDSHNMSVQFQRYYVVKGSVSDGGGTLEPAMAKVDEGAPHIVRIKPDPGYFLAELWINDKMLDVPTLTYTFPKVGEPNTVLAVFRKAPTFRLILMDTVVYGKGEDPVERRPEICVDWDGQYGPGSYCNPGLVDLNIPSGSKVRIGAQKSVEVCSFGFCTERPFTFWYRPGFGRIPPTYISDNPYTFELISDYGFKVVYGGAKPAIGTVDPIGTMEPIGSVEQ